MSDKKTYRDFTNYLKTFPDKDGRYGVYGAYLPPELEPAFKEITDAYKTICHSTKFIEELRRIRPRVSGQAHTGLPL